MRKSMFVVNKTDNPLPAYETIGSAGMDLRSAENVVIGSMEQRKFGTGIHVQIPEGYEGTVRSRSGFSYNNQTIITTGLGTIDSDYRGEIQIVMFNLSKQDVVIKKGDRVAQLIISPVEQVDIIEVENLEETSRGSNGFGSTGQ